MLDAELCYFLCETSDNSACTFWKAQVGVERLLSFEKKNFITLMKDNNVGKKIWNWQRPVEETRCSLKRLPGSLDKLAPRQRPLGWARDERATRESRVTISCNVPRAIVELVRLLQRQAGKLGKWALPCESHRMREHSASALYSWTYSNQ